MSLLSSSAKTLTGLLHSNSLEVVSALVKPKLCSVVYLLTNSININYNEIKQRENKTTIMNKIKYKFMNKNYFTNKTQAMNYHHKKNTSIHLTLRFSYLYIQIVVNVIVFSMVGFGLKP